MIKVMKVKSQKVSKAESQRLAQLERCIPDIWEYRKVLYVGANSNRFFFASVLSLHKMDVTVMEIDESRSKEVAWKYPMFEVLCKDIRKIGHTMYDAIWWIHGPTMLPRSNIIPTIRKIENYGRLVVLAVPWGKYDASAELNYRLDGNKTPMYEKDFEDLGYKTDCIGKKDVNGSNLLAWKVTE